MDEDEVKYIDSKLVLSRLRNRDNCWGITYDMNLYRGCQHGCIYCDMRSACYHLGDISQIYAKRNVCKLLEAELAAKRIKATIGIGTMSDSYMPLEKQIGVTREALVVISRYHFPVHVMTKSNLVCRDIDVLQDIARSYAAVTFSMTTVDDELAHVLEPCAPPPSVRLRAMKELADHGIYTGIALRPVLPFINDSVEDVISVLEYAVEMGASYVLPMFELRLRTGSRSYFYAHIEKRFPIIPKQYQTYFAERQECISPNTYYLNLYFQEKISELGICSEMKFYNPKEKGQLSLF